MSTTTAGRRGQTTRAGEPRKYGLDAVILTMAIACGLTVANLYYAQPLLALIAGTFGVSRGAAATVVTVTQLGYAAGLAFLVPLGDRLDNRRFSCWALLAVAVALAVAALSPVFPLFLLMSAIIGVTSVTVQVLVPFAARLAPARQRGRYVGRVMSGLLLGILLARSVASVAAAAWGWRSIYLISAVAMLLLAAALWRILPSRPPATSTGYGRLLASALPLIRAEPVLRRRALAQAMMFGAFSCFWTSIAYELISAHHLSQLGIAVFALVGAGGAAAALIAGRLGDRGLGRPVRGAAIALAVAAMAAGRRRGGQPDPARRGRRPARPRRSGQPRAQPARHLRAPPGRQRPAQHGVHDHGVPRRRGRVRGVRRADRDRRVDGGGPVRRGAGGAGRRGVRLRSRPRRWRPTDS